MTKTGPDGSAMAGADASGVLERALEVVVNAVGADLVDVEFRPGVVLVTVERNERLDLDDLSSVSRTISAFFDEHDEFAPSGRYQLEVSSPGLERRLRRAAHFRRALGDRVAIRTIAGAPGERRAEGVLSSADDDEIVVVIDDASERHIKYGDIDRAHVVFDWRRALAQDSKTERGNKAPARTRS